MDNEINNTQTYQKQPDEIFCHSCGKPIKMEAEICPFCGVRQKISNKKKGSKKKILIVIGILISIIIILKIANNPDNISSEETKIEQENLKNKANELLAKLEVKKDDFQNTAFVNSKSFYHYDNSTAVSMYFAIDIEKYKIENRVLKVSQVSKGNSGQLGKYEVTFLSDGNTYKKDLVFSSYRNGFDNNYNFYEVREATMGTDFIDYMREALKNNTIKVRISGYWGTVDRVLSKNEKQAFLDMVELYDILIQIK